MVRTVCKLLFPCCFDEGEIDQGKVLIPPPQDMPIQQHGTSHPKVAHLMAELKRFAEFSLLDKHIVIFNRMGNDAPQSGIETIQRAAKADTTLVLCFFDQNTTFKHQLLKGLAQEKNVLCVSYEDLDAFFVDESQAPSAVKYESQQLHNTIAFNQKLIRVNMIGKAVDIGLLMDSLIVSTLFEKLQLLERNEVMVSHEQMTKAYDPSVHRHLEKHANRRNQLVISDPIDLGKYKLNPETHLALIDSLHVGVVSSEDAIQSFLRRTHGNTEDAMAYGDFASIQSRLRMATEGFFIGDGACSIAIEADAWRYVDRHTSGSWSRNAPQFDTLNQLLDAMVARIQATGKVETLKHWKDAAKLSNGEIKSEVDLVARLVQHMQCCGVNQNSLPGSLVVKSTDPDVLAFMKGCDDFKDKPFNAEYAYRSLRPDVPKFILTGDPAFEDEQNFVRLHRPKKDYKQAISPEQNEKMLERQLAYNQALNSQNPRGFQDIKDSSDLMAERFKQHPWYEKAMSGQG